MTTLTLHEEEEIAGAIVRARELFDAAPWLKTHDIALPGCMHFTWVDLFTLQKFAEDRFDDGVSQNSTEDGK